MLKPVDFTKVTDVVETSKAIDSNFKQIAEKLTEKEVQFLLNVGNVLSLYYEDGYKQLENGVNAVGIALEKFQDDLVNFGE